MQGVGWRKIRFRGIEVKVILLVLVFMLQLMGVQTLSAPSSFNGANASVSVLNSDVRDALRLAEKDLQSGDYKRAAEEFKRLYEMRVFRSPKHELERLMLLYNYLYSQFKLSNYQEVLKGTKNLKNELKGLKYPYLKIPLFSDYDEWQRKKRELEKNTDLLEKIAKLELKKQKEDRRKEKKDEKNRKNRRNNQNSNSLNSRKNSKDKNKSNQGKSQGEKSKKNHQNGKSFQNKKQSNKKSTSSSKKPTSSSGEGSKSTQTQKPKKLDRNEEKNGSNVEDREFKRRIGLQPQEEQNTGVNRAYIQMLEEMLRAKKEMLQDMMDVMGRDDPMVRELLNEVKAMEHQLRRMKGRTKRRVVREW